MDKVTFAIESEPHFPTNTRSVEREGKKLKANAKKRPNEWLHFYLSRSNRANFLHSTNNNHVVVYLSLSLLLPPSYLYVLTCHPWNIYIFFLVTHLLPLPLSPLPPLLFHISWRGKKKKEKNSNLSKHEFLHYMKERKNFISNHELILQVLSYYIAKIEKWRERKTVKKIYSLCTQISFPSSMITRWIFLLSFSIFFCSHLNVWTLTWKVLFIFLRNYIHLLLI